MENRSELRITTDNTVILKMLAESPDGDPAEFLIAETLDTSSNGLKILTKAPLLDNALYELSITADTNTLKNTHDRRFNLMGEVKWVAKTNCNEYKTGIRIHNSDGTDFRNWKLHLLNILQDT